MGPGHREMPCEPGLVPRPSLDLTIQLASRGHVVKPKLLALGGRETEFRIQKGLLISLSCSGHSVRMKISKVLQFTQLHRSLNSTTADHLLESFLPRILKQCVWGGAISPSFVFRYTHCKISEEATGSSSLRLSLSKCRSEQFKENSLLCMTVSHNTA